ncbi:MAG: hypothetical protein KDC61_22710, partial [Saprospiraceae bacterium]|nr:hypothetical protein [Saprospiraceae bacterium]
NVLCVIVARNVVATNVLCVIVVKNLVMTYAFPEMTPAQFATTSVTLVPAAVPSFLDQAKA